MRDALVALVAAVVSIGCRGVTAPAPPDLSATVAAYGAPTTALDATLAEAVAQRVVTNARGIEAARALPLLSILLETLQPEMAPSVDAGMPAPQTKKEIEVGAVRLSGNGYLTLDAQCPGWGPDDPTPGTLELTVLIVDTAVFEVVWGSLAHCRFASESTEFVVDGAIEAALDRPLTLDDFEVNHVTTRIDVEVATASEPAPERLAFDFRVLTVGGLELRVEGAEGRHVIARVSEGVWAIDATNGTFSCDFDARRCERSDTMEVITW